MRRIIFTLLFGIICTSAWAQYFVEAHTRWNDTFREWNVLLESVDGEDSIEGNLALQQFNRGDWSRWNFMIGDVSGTIRPTWKDDLSNWRIQAEGNIINARTKWRGDVKAWEIRNGSDMFVLKSKFVNVLNEWHVNSKTHGNFVIYTDYESDPRDWVIIDEMSETVTVATKMSFVFLALFHGSPKI